MGSYVNFLRKLGVTGSAAANAQALFNQLYDRAHGSDRYWMSNTPWGLMRKLEDKAKRAQDEYDNTKRILLTLITMILLLAVWFLDLPVASALVFLEWLAPLLQCIRLKLAKM